MFGFEDMDFAVRSILLFMAKIMRYLVFSGGAYLLYYVIKKHDWFFMKIQQRHPKNKQVATEIKYSLLTFLVFTGIGSVIFLLIEQGYLKTKVYTDFNEHGILYFLFTIAALFFIHDTYFYWTHRLMHHPRIYRHVHRVHHMATDPTPWSTFAFHPWEALIDGGIVFFVFFLFPVHYLALVVFGTVFILINTMGHLGFEIFPKRMLQHPVFKYLNTSTNHNMHHQYVKCNYGLYFNIWDRLMGTNHARYEQVYEEVTQRREEGFKARRSTAEKEGDELVKA